MCECRFSARRFEAVLLSSLLLFLGCLPLASCASTKGAFSSKYRVYVTNTKKVPLLPTSCMDGTLDALHLFTGSFGESQFSFQTYIYADDSELSFVLLNEFGVDMGTLLYADGSLSLDSAVFPPSLKPEYIVADFQNAFYSDDFLRMNYEASGLSFEVERSAAGEEIRRVKSRGAVIEEIIRGNGVTSITNVLRGYKYVLTEADD